jgi:hypothetical protein
MLFAQSNSTVRERLIRAAANISYDGPEAARREQAALRQRAWVSRYDCKHAKPKVRTVSPDPIGLAEFAEFNSAVLQSDLDELRQTEYDGAMVGL